MKNTKRNLCLTISSEMNRAQSFIYNSKMVYENDYQIPFHKAFNTLAEAYYNFGMPTTVVHTEVSSHFWFESDSYHACIYTRDSFPKELDNHQYEGIQAGFSLYDASEMAY